MLDLLIQRLRSKTYWAGMVGLALTAIDISSGAITGWLPAQYRPFAVLVWPMAMLTLREVTTAALSEK